MASPQTWTDQDVADLRRMHAGGMSMSVMADRLPGKTRNAVISKVHRLGLAAREPGRHASAKLSTTALRSARASQAGRLGGRMKAKNGLAPLIFGPVKSTKPTPPSPLPVCKDEVNATLMSLGHGQCRWPIGDPREPGFGFCGGKALSGKPYCPRHHDRAYRY